MNKFLIIFLIIVSTVLTSVFLIVYYNSINYEEPQFITNCLKSHLMPITTYLLINKMMIPITNYYTVCDQSEIIDNPKFRKVKD